MKTNLLLSILVTALLASCGRSQKTDTAAPDRTPPDKVGKVPAEEPPISQPLPPSNLPIQWATSPNAKMTIIERIPFGSAHSTKEEVEEFVKGMDNPNLYHAIISVQPMMGKRTPEGMKAMMQLLKEQLDQLPVTAPSSQEFEAAEKSLGQSIEASRNKHFLTTFRKAQKLAACLVGYGVPEAREAAENYRKTMHERWGGSEAAAVHLRSLDWEFKHAYQMIEDGTAPWQERKFSE